MVIKVIIWDVNAINDKNLDLVEQIYTKKEEDVHFLLLVD